MTLNLPRPDVLRFSALSPEGVLLAYLANTPQAISLSTLRARLKKLIGPEQIDAAVSALIERGEASLDKNICLTAKGKDAARKVLGQDATETWERIKARRLPVMVLGLDPDAPEVRRKFAKSDALKSAAIAVAFDLPEDTMASTRAVCGELVWRLLRVGLPGVVGKGPFPLIEKPATVERVLLAGLAGVRAKTLPDAVSGLAAAAVGLEKCDATALRERLIEIGLERATAGAPVGGSFDAAPKAQIPAANGSFAARVREVAGALTTQPFQGRVAIAQVYDAYGKVHPDAGSLVSFKERLVAAAKARDLELGRLDLPERMARDLRERSETSWGGDEVHFLITAWN